MSNRERWVVYPLLFFSILLAARDDLVPPTEVMYPKIVCNELYVKANGETLVSAGRSTGGEDGVILVHGDGDAPLLKIGHSHNLEASGMFALDDSNIPITASTRTHDQLPAGPFNWNKSSAPDSPPETVDESVESPRSASKNTASADSQ